MSLKAQFVLAGGISSTLIEIGGGGTNTLGFSHCDIVLPGKIANGYNEEFDPDREYLLGSRTDFPIDGQTGVQIRDWDYGKATWIRQEVFELSATPEQEIAFYDYAFAQVGKPYDKLAIIAFFIARDWRDEGAWFCDEYLLACTEQAKLCPSLYLPTNKFTPTGAACIWSALGAKVVAE